MVILRLRRDDLERQVRGAVSGGINLGTGLVTFGNVPRLNAYPPRPCAAPQLGMLRNAAAKEVELPAPPSRWRTETVHLLAKCRGQGGGASSSAFDPKSSASKTQQKLYMFYTAKRSCEFLSF